MDVLLIVLVGIFRDGKLLLLKRNREPFKGLWSLVGGKMDAGETIEQCALREAKEETGLDACFVALKGVAFEMVNDAGKPPLHQLLFICVIDPSAGGAVSSDEGELRWVSLEELPSYEKLFIPSDYRMTQDFL
ncbi:hypothetical protein AUJ14_00005, partial [Candidatus Micrarchaeota archaeon CG1_02_55_22]